MKDVIYEVVELYYILCYVDILLLEEEINKKLFGKSNILS